MTETQGPTRIKRYESWREQPWRARTLPWWCSLVFIVLGLARLVVGTHGALTVLFVALVLGFTFHLFRDVQRVRRIARKK